LLILIAVVAAILGNNLGYLTGKKLGHRLFTRHESVLFSPKRVEQAHDFFEKQGPKSLILARFIPGVRTFVPIIGGTAKMDYRRFLIFNSIGGLLWGILLPILGYTLGHTIPNIDHYLLPIIVVIVIISLLPLLVEYLKAKKQ
jgi:membrane-associated protein